MLLKWTSKKVPLFFSEHLSSAFHPRINPNHAIEISEFIGRSITLFHRVDSRIAQRISLKMLPMRNAGYMQLKPMSLNPMPFFTTLPSFDTRTMNSTVIETTKAIISITSDGHVLIRIKEQEDLHVIDIKDTLAAKRSLIGEIEHTVIFVTARFGTVSPEAREFSASPEVGKKVIARAIVTKSLSSRMLSNFYLRINKPSTPTRIFENEEDAADWLNKIREKERRGGRELGNE